MSEIIVSKFGGSSLATADKIKKIAKIVNDDSRRKVVVVSAPGKNSSNDTKVTDMLIELAEKKDYSIIDKIKERYCDIFCPLGIEKQEIEVLIKETLEQRLGSVLIDKAVMDSVKAFGEEANARLIAKVNRWKYIDPKEYIMVSDDFGNAKVHDETYKRLKKLNLEFSVSVIPGFYGYTRDKVIPVIATFSRGGSDLTGAVVAAGLDAILYENFTDQDGVMAANPSIIPDAKLINEMTYKEIRDLSYMGFSILHQDAMRPTELKGIPIHIRNTEKYPKEGTYIVPERISETNKPIIGVAYKNGFCSFNIERFGLNEEEGIAKKILEIFEKEDLSVEFMPGAIDDLSVILREDQIKDSLALGRIENSLYKLIGKGSEITFDQDLGAIVIAGKGIKNEIGVGYKVGDLLSENGIKTRFILKGPKERCFVLGIDSKQGNEAVKLIYHNFIE